MPVLSLLCLGVVLVVVLVDDGVVDIADVGGVGVVVCCCCCCHC